tara:strand:- start:1036 stop:1686 length:651 start_codon:yes stop_codon:yes gene_type:complete
MKIYTKIIYEWLDGKLVEQSSDSFEYEGELTLCGVGGGGGGGGGTLNQVVKKGADFTSDVVTDPVGTTTDVLSDTADTVVGGAGDVVDVGMQNVQTGVEMTTDNLAAGVDSLAMNQGMATTLSDWRENMQTNMAPVQEELGRWADATITNIQGIQDYAMEKAEELTDFVHGPRPEETVAVNKGALKGGVKKKSKSDLAVNKGKQRARQTLRISNTA